MTAQPELLTRRCAPCNDETPGLTEAQVGAYRPSVPLWELRDGTALRRRFRFADFAGSMAFVNTVAALAEAEGHHPDILVSYNRVRLDLTTHAIGGLSENDFIMAAKIDQL